MERKKKYEQKNAARVRNVASIVILLVEQQIENNGTLVRVVRIKVEFFAYRKRRFLSHLRGIASRRKSDVFASG